jgi:serine/threonine-protein kinase
MTGDIGGTVAFMPPEQITEYREARPPADQYAAAATLYNLLTKAYIYNLPTDFQKQLLMILHDDPVPIGDRRQLPSGLANVIHRGLAREPADRWPNVMAMREALRPFEA